jgi:hypothetical protein
VIDSPVISTVDYDAPGKQFGRLQIPRSTNESGWSNLVVPLVCIANGRGPTVLVTGGVHGDEPEGQVAALNLARDTQPGDVRGRLIIFPCLSPEASRAYTRLWPSGTNLNRSFPGSPTGSPDEVLADYLTRVLFPLTSAVCDIHSGGRTLLCLPWSEIHLVDDRAQRAAMWDAMLAWNTDFHFVYINIAGSGLLVDEAERQGKVVVGTELGGGGHVIAEISGAMILGSRCRRMIRMSEMPRLRAASGTSSGTPGCCRARLKRAPPWACRRRPFSRRSIATTTFWRPRAGSSRPWSFSGRRSRRGTPSAAFISWSVQTGLRSTSSPEPPGSSARFGRLQARSREIV